MSASAQPTRRPVSIDGRTHMGAVRLTVSDLSRARSFYERVLGLPVHDLHGGELALGPDPEHPLVILRGDPSAPSLDPRATGLFHLAVLVPTRRDLAESLARVAMARWPLDGASDHLVSEALYLSDPDGNGIEIYRDRPRDDWPRDGERLQMATLPLDLDDILSELAGAERPSDTVPAGTSIGHVHLQVSELESAETFYSGVLGFDVMVRGYPGALFVSAGGYHHHLGLNTWRSANSAPPQPGSVGLLAYEVVLPDDEALELVRGRVRDAGLPTEPAPDDDAAALAVRDPSGNLVVLRSEAAG